MKCSHGVGIWDYCAKCAEARVRSAKNARVEDTRRCLRLHIDHCRATGRYTNDHQCFGRRST